MPGNAASRGCEERSPSPWAAGCACHGSHTSVVQCDIWLFVVEPPRREECPELSCARVEASQEWLRTGLRQGVEGRTAPGQGPDLAARMQQLSREWGTDSSGGADDGNLHGVSRGRGQNGRRCAAHSTPRFTNSLNTGRSQGPRESG